MKTEDVKFENMTKREQEHQFIELVKSLPFDHLVVLLDVYGAKNCHRVREIIHDCINTNKHINFKVKSRMKSSKEFGWHLLIQKQKK